ncbi:MAG: MATE family efflux transporter [Propionibacterium sp.]|nr:MATE family efflux transporter [Propionibacterium sp.]
MMLADTWIVGRLGTVPLAGLGIGAVVLTTMTGIMIFLAYGSTATVSRQVGAGNRKRASELGVQAIWLAFVLGLILVLLTFLFASWIATALGAEGGVHEQAVEYLRWSVPGMPGMLVMLAATGTFRGMADARTPLVLLVSAASLNFVLNLFFVYVVGMGIGGAGLGTAVAETMMGGAAVYLIARQSRRVGARLHPVPADMWMTLRVGIPLMLRTLALRISVLITTYVATAQGAAALAAHHVVMQVWNFLANVLDAIAIAGQTIIGTALGAANREEARESTRLMTRWALGVGFVLGIVVFLARAPVAGFFASDLVVRDYAVWLFVIVAAGLPLAGYVFLLDGVLIGAGDGPYLAKAGVVALLIYGPLALSVLLLPRGQIGLVGLWLAFVFGYMGARALTLWWRARGDDWMVEGA